MSHIGNKIMKCACGGNERRRKVSKEISLAGQKIFVENVDAFVCDKCGEIYFDGSTLLKLEKQVQKKVKIAA